MIKGSIVALITPFDEENNIDFVETYKLLDMHIEMQTDGILLLGTTGEAEALSDAEKRKYVENCLKHLNGKIKVMVGTIANTPNRVIELIKLFEGLDIDSFLVIGPYYIKSNNSGLIKYFTYIADNSSKPIIIYNVPKRAGFNLDVNVVRDLSRHPNIIGIKEASGDIAYLSRIARFCNDDFVLYSGDDFTIIPALSMGASGIISVIANAFPKEVKLITNNNEISKMIFFKLFDLIEDIYIETSPILIKYLLYLKGFNVKKVRMPLAEATISSKRKLEEDYLTIIV